MRVDEEFSGADAPRKYQADEVVHAIDRIPGPRDGQLIRRTGAPRGRWHADAAGAAHPRLAPVYRERAATMAG